MALDADRNVYVTGWTYSADFPTRNAMQTHLADACCGADSFITKLNAAGDQLVFSTYFGGADGTDVGRGIAVDKNNNVYVVGYTNSFAFPTTNPIQEKSTAARRTSTASRNGSMLTWPRSMRRVSSGFTRRTSAVPATT